MQSVRQRFLTREWDIGSSIASVLINSPQTARSLSLKFKSAGLAQTEVSVQRLPRQTRPNLPAKRRVTGELKCVHAASDLQPGWRCESITRRAASLLAPFSFARDDSSRTTSSSRPLIAAWRVHASPTPCTVCSFLPMTNSSSSIRQQTTPQPSVACSGSSQAGAQEPVRCGIQPPVCLSGTANILPGWTNTNTDTTAAGPAAIVALFFSSPCASSMTRQAPSIDMNQTPGSIGVNSTTPSALDSGSPCRLHMNMMRKQSAGFC